MFKDFEKLNQRALTFSLVLLHIEVNGGTFCIIPAGYILVKRTVRTKRLRHVDLGQISPLVNPATVTTESIQLVVSDQIRSKVFFPESDTF